MSPSPYAATARHKSIGQVVLYSVTGARGLRRGYSVCSSEVGDEEATVHCSGREESSQNDKAGTETNPSLGSWCSSTKKATSFTLTTASRTARYEYNHLPRSTNLALTLLHCIHHIACWNRLSTVVHASFSLSIYNHWEIIHCKALRFQH